MTTSTADAFASLAALELITARQRMAVERHPACASFLALHDPVQQLPWMHAHKIISEDELDDMASFDDEPCERETILQAALQEIERANDLRNGRFLDRLLRDGMITPIQHAAALRDPSGLYNETAADMLYELILFDILSPADFSALRKRIRANAGTNGGLDRLQMVEDVKSRLDAQKKAHRSNPGTIRMVTDPAHARRLGWTYFGIIALTIGAIAWLLFH